MLVSLLLDLNKVNVESSIFIIFIIFIPFPIKLQAIRQEHLFHEHLRVTASSKYPPENSESF